MSYQTYASMFTAATTKYGLPAGLLPAVAENESGFNASARSPAGAMGLMQFMPGTARSYGINALDPRQAIDGAARYFKHLLSLFGGDQAKAIAGYNAGEGAVQKYGGIPPYAETQHYVTAVLASEKKYGGNGSNAPATIDTPPAATAPAAFGLPGGAEITATLTKVLITGTAVAAGAGLVLLGLNRATGNPAGKATKAAVDVAL